MFDLARWQKEAQHGLLPFLKRPRREPFLAGTSSLLVYLVVRTIEPFLEAYEADPIEATLTLATVDRGLGANYLVRNAAQLRHQGAHLLRHELDRSAPLRATIEQLLITLGIIELVRSGLDDIQSEWFRVALSNELQPWSVGGELVELQEALDASPWRSRYAAIQAVRARVGSYSSADLALLLNALHDGSNHVRAAAARSLGHLGGPLPLSVQQALLERAVHDHDLGTRYAAARSLGTLREHLAIDDLLAQLTAAVADEDSFVRSAASLVLGQLGSHAARPPVIDSLIGVLKDSDPYAREAAAQALGLLGTSAATREVLAALTLALQDTDFYVHEAAASALARLREFGPTPDELINASLVA